MGVFTDAGKNALLDNIETEGWHAALFNGEPGSGGTEVLSRIALADKLGVAASGALASNEDVSWTADGPVTATWVGLYDAAVAGNLMAKHQLATSRSLVADDVLTIPSGSLEFSLTDA